MRKVICLMMGLLIGSGMAGAKNELEKGFIEPPVSARPHTWWHWMNGNISGDGITADLEAMARVGIGGAQIFNAAEGIPRGPIVYNSPEWRDLVKHAAVEAKRLGLELGIHNCAGWSSSGGPWNTPEHAMQVVVSADMKVKGPIHLEIDLPVPKVTLDCYRDIAVLAFPSAEGQVQATNNLAARIFAKRAYLGNTEGTMALRTESILDVTAFVSGQADFRKAKLIWDVPAGEWTLLRLGFTPNGQRNHPAPEEGSGLECDKLSAEAVQAHWDGGMGKLVASLGRLVGKSFNNVLIDSYEKGSQNWTPMMREEFRKRCGYDLMKYLPVLTGRVVDSSAVSDRFLWDFRRVIADLFAENYSGKFAEMAHKSGMTFAVESYGDCPADDLQYGSFADMPMAEFWAGQGDYGTIKLAASIGHVYGRQYIGAESFTAWPNQGKWQQDPYSLKMLGDAAFCGGINRIIYHRYAHQPWTSPTRYPGMTMVQWGTHFERTCTWWEQGRDWLKYQARCQYLLQSGVFVADALFYCGEGVPNSLNEQNVRLAQGYDYDGCDTRALFERVSVKGGKIVLPNGAAYRVLVLPATKSMSPRVARRIRELADAGAVIVGSKPERAPGLSGYPACDEEVRRLVSDWKVIADKTPEQAIGLDPDFSWTGREGLKVRFIHRSISGSDVYFVASASSGPQDCSSTSEDCVLSFRQTGRQPELWHPDTGRIEPCGVWREKKGRTEVPVHLDPAGSVFVVFRRRAPAEHLVAAERRGAPAPLSVVRDELVVRRAVYGYFADHGDGWVDITAKVKASVAPRKIWVSNEFADSDPAPGQPKAMRVEIMRNGLRECIMASENTYLELPDGTEVLRAHYGRLPDPDRIKEQNVDVTAKVAGKVHEGRLTVKADNNLTEKDPAPNQQKELNVEYLLNGIEGSLRCKDGENISIPGNRLVESAEPAVFDVVGNVLATRVPGSFELVYASGRTNHLEVAEVPAPVDLSGAWDIEFPPDWGAPAKIKLDRLMSWTLHPDAGIKYFSGTATYRKKFRLHDSLIGKRLELNLGRVKNLAEVQVNGRRAGLVWKAPFLVDITGCVKKGENDLEVKVTNLWVNRLIGDEQLPEDREWAGICLKEWPKWVVEGKPSPTGRFTFTTWRHWKKNDQPLESGLLGPVTIRVVEQITLP